jgi:hypothetical protein
LIIILENKEEEKSEESEEDFSDKETHSQNVSQVYDFWEKEEDVSVKENPNKDGDMVLEGLDGNKEYDEGSDSERKVNKEEPDQVDQKQKEADPRFEI